MYTHCTFCYGPLGANHELESFPVSRRVAFDPARGWVWAVCTTCQRWNLAPIEERWEVVDECERRFRRTTLRYTSGNIGLAWLGAELDLVRIGPALRPEVAAWRYGRTVAQRTHEGSRELGRRAVRAAIAVRRVLRGSSPNATVRHTMGDLLLGAMGHTVADVVRIGDASQGADLPLAVIRLRHLVQARLVRPEPGQPWSLVIPHDQGTMTLAGEAGLRAAARMLAIVNGTERGRGFTPELLASASAKVDESARADSYFNRVLSIALRTSWGRFQHEEGGVATVESLEVATSETERLAWRLTGRTFWGRGGIGSDPATQLVDVPLVDRLALEMAAHEESERRAMDGELDALRDAWKTAAEIAAIADALI